MSTRGGRSNNDERVRKAITDILSGDSIIAVDVGARGDIPEVWLPLDGIADFVSFDADPQACERLRHVYASRGSADRYRVLPLALAGRTGARTLFATNAPGGSSLFNIDVPIVRDYTDDDYLYPIRPVVIEARKAHDVFEEIGCRALHLMKLDVQGAELEILRSLDRNWLQSTLCIQLEAVLQRKSHDYPMFCEVDTFVRSFGLELFDIAPVRVHRTLRGKRRNYLEGLLGVHMHAPSVAGRVWETEALYFRMPESLDKSDPAAFRRLVVVYALYGLFTEALHAVETAFQVSAIDRADRDSLERSVLSWHRSGPYRWWHSARGPADCLRRIARRLTHIVPSVPGALER